MEVGAILLYCFYACLQMYILMVVGMLGVWKKLINEKKSKVFSAIVFSLVIPMFQIVQISSAGTYDKLKLIWVIIVNFLVSMGLSYLITKLFHVVLKMEIRVKESFAAMCTFPAVGALPLVIGYSYCFPGGPIEDDPFCAEFYGVMFLSVMVLNFGLFFVGYVLLLLDKKNTEVLETKMSYVWPELVDEMYDKKNCSILQFFKDFFKDPSKAQEVYDRFIENNELPASDEFDIKQRDINNDQQDINIKDEDIESGRGTEGNFIKRKQHDNNENNNNTNLDINTKLTEYYQKAFAIIEENIDPGKKKFFEIIKKNHMESINLKPPKYPICKTVHIDKTTGEKIEKTYDKWLTQVKQTFPEFEPEFKVSQVDIIVLLKSLISPPNTAFFLGLTLALSKVRDLMFGDNVYFDNIMDGFKLITSNLTPFLFLVIGVACLPQPKEEMKELRYSVLTKSHTVVIFLVRFLIIPALGVLAIWFWREVYGKECVTSPVFRLVLFFPWCLPSSTTFAVLVSMSGYFFEEYGYLVLIQNFSCVVLLTLLNMIYFLIIGI